MGKKIIIDDETREKILKLYKTTRSSSKVAKELGYNSQRILKELHLMGINPNGNVPSKEQIETVCKLYQDGISQEELEDMVHLTRPTIRKILRNNNIHIRKPLEQEKQYPANDNYFNQIDTPNKAYILGFLYADGNVSGTNNMIQIALQARDVHILESMKKEFGFPQKPLVFDERSKKYGNKKQDIYVLTFKNNQMHMDLEKWGVVPRKTKTLTYPDFLDESLHRHFIRGVMDGDGCIHNCRNTNCCAIDICGTYNFCIKLKDLIESILDIHCSVICISKKQNRETYRVTISGRNQCVSFLNWIYEDAEMFLYRKYELFLSQYLNVA